MQRSGQMKTRPRQRAAALMLTVALAIGLFPGCAKPLLTCPRALSAPEPEPPPPAQPASAILFATDRLPKSQPDQTFSSDLNRAAVRMSYGVKCADPQSGHDAVCAQPAWLNQPLPAGLSREQFLDTIRAGNSDVLLFVHGFYFSFDESLEMTLRIVERSRVQAIPVAYSWPSLGKLSAYGSDYDRNEWAIDHLQELIGQLVQALPRGHVLHIVAHSMGNRAVLWALARLHLPGERLGQLIMIAPDVDTEVFEDLVPRSGAFVRRTVYVSSHDLALRAAGLLRSGTSRAGDARKQYVVIKEMDTIDASPLSAGVIGHSLYDYPQRLFDDLGAVLNDQAPSARKLTACTVISIDRYNTEHGTSLPCTVYRLPAK